MKPYFSIIIPYHNSKDTIGSLLDSIVDSKKAPPLEVIVVDDGSEKPANNVIPAKAGILKIPHHVRDDKMRKWKTLDVRIHTLFYNKGPGAARNRGAVIAKGKFLVFFDSDVVLFPDALHNLWQIYTNDPDIVAVTGVWVKHQRTKKFFPNFKALRDWSYWINERDKSGYYYLFSTRCASIKREVFKRLKGFDERYTSPLVEDIEFTYRVARRYAIIFAPNVRVHHEFEDFLPIAKKYFWRSYFWTKLYQSRKKFDPVATTLQEAVTALSGVSIVGISFVVILSFLLRSTMYAMPAGRQDVRFMNNANIDMFFIVLLTSYIVLLVFHTMLIRKFLVFVYQEKGIVFAIKSFFMGLILYCFIAAGAFWGRLK
jgi:glycosyltransferase involved in cell wall biosynthesis